MLINAWKAVYFDHDLDGLTALVHAAAGVGVERFVLDDGWFHGRRSDRSGLGDWTVDDQQWPEGLHPLIDSVHEAGMGFGLRRAPRRALRRSLRHSLRVRGPAQATRRRRASVAR